VRNDPPTRRWPRRLIATLTGCLLSAVAVAVQIPAVREAIGIANSIYRLIDSTVPSLGVASLWIGFGLIVGGVVATWRSQRINGSMTKMMTEGSAVLTAALGVLVALVGSFNQPTSLHVTPPTGKHHHTTHHHRHPAPAKHSSGGSSTAGGSPHTTTTTTPTSTSAPAPAPAPAPSPSPSPSSGGSSSTSGGGGGNTVTINKSTNQTSETGNAEGPNATSGPATDNNNESTNISIG
jgi:hypothetical protein